MGCGSSKTITGPFISSHELREVVVVTEEKWVVEQAGKPPKNNSEHPPSPSWRTKKQEPRNRAIIGSMGAATYSAALPEVFSS